MSCWPKYGESQPDMSEIEQIPELLSKLSEVVQVMDESKTEDTARWAKAEEESKAIAAELQTLTEEKQKRDREEATAKAQAELKELLEGAKSSKAGFLGQHGRGQSIEAEASGFLRAVWMAGSRDAAGQAAAKATLQAYGSIYQTPEEAGSKATLGSTDATGGYIIPNNLVETIMKPKTAENIYRSLLTVVSGVRGSGVDQPLRGFAPTKMVVAAWGATKENLNLQYDNYTATLYTIARIYDVGNQFLRQSEGAAQTDVLQELGKAAALGEAYYTLSGSGTGEPRGLLTVLGTSGTYVTAHTAAQTTIAGNIASAVAKASADLATRSRVPTAAVMNATDFWITMASGADAAGFYIAPSGGATSVDLTGGRVSIWGIPLYADPNMPLDSMVIGEWSAAKFYTGQGFRIDSSSEAGTRWDANLTGFRGEEEIGFEASPAVYTGAFQRIIDTRE
jgi:HK97 family phage major capsid protein